MNIESGKDLEIFLFNKYAEAKHRFQTALFDPTQYKKVCDHTGAMLSILKTVEKSKPHAAYMIDNLESTHLKLKYITTLTKREAKAAAATKSGITFSKMSFSTTLESEKFMQEKMEKLKDKQKNFGFFKGRGTWAKDKNAGDKSDNQPSNGFGASTFKTGALSKNKPLIRTFGQTEDNEEGDSKFGFKKPKLENNSYFQKKSEESNSYKPFFSKPKETEEPEESGFTSAKNQLGKNLPYKKDYGQTTFDNNGTYQKKPFYKKDEEKEEASDFGGFTTARDKFVTNQQKKTGGYNNANNRYGSSKFELEDNSPVNKYGKFNRFQKQQEEPEEDNTQNLLNNADLVNKVHMSVFNKRINTAANVNNATTSNLGSSGAANPGSSLNNNQPNGLRKKFVPPLKNGENNKPAQGAGKNEAETYAFANDERYKGLDPKLVETIESEIVDRSPKIKWNDIAGLEFAKKTIYEIIVWPMLRPDIFNGLRAPPRGLLLFGPPGTGKTMIGRAIASESNSTFFSISASSLTSKWVGEGEKLVKTLFSIAVIHQPSVIFIDEIDSLLCARSEKDEESSRRIKTEFLVQLEGTRTMGDERILVIGATNRPQELDEAVKRRFQKRLYIPLPNDKARRQLINTIVETETSKGNNYNLSEEDILKILNLTKGYSGADMRNLCAEASLIPIRSITDITNLSRDALRATDLNDFLEALRIVKATVSNKDLGMYLEWNQTYGSFQFGENELEK